MNKLNSVPHFYRSAGYTIYPRSCKIISPHGIESTIRAKTFQLLQLLIDAKGQIQSKEIILQTIWNDVVVDEQIIFQSIKELRKIFNGSDVIKTFPRRGYAWLPSVELCNETSSVANPQKQSKGLKRLFVLYKRTLVAFGGLFITCLVVWQLLSNSAAISGSVVVLPVQTNIRDSDHKWLRYGAMDQLIQRLSSSEHYGVLQTDYVLEVMARAQTPYDNFTKQDIGKLFQVSGATLVVELKVTGSVQDYQLLYSLHEKNSMELGAVFDKSISGAVDQVAMIVAARLGQDTLVNDGQYQSAFSNELLANALEFIQAGQGDAAVTLLEASISTEPSNITAKRILIKLLVEKSAYLKAQSLLDEALKQATDTDDSNELVRLLFWQGAAFAQQGDVELALAYFNKAEHEADNIKDWLFLAHIAEIRGRIHQSKQEYPEADARYSEALRYYQILQCPYGQSNVMLDQSTMSFQQGDQKGALQLANQSLLLIEQRQLESLKPQAQEWLQTVINRQNDKK
jgi:DNA-binding winged helix-turn-helix (wHTH) protein/tetratricopeptide (TPR) repeat protein